MSGSEIFIDLELASVRSQIRGLHAQSLELCTDLLQLLSPFDDPKGPAIAAPSATQLVSNRAPVVRTRTQVVNGHTVTATPAAHRQAVQVTRGFDSVERGLMEITDGTRSLESAAPRLALPAPTAQVLDRQQPGGEGHSATKLALF